VPVKETEIS